MKHLLLMLLIHVLTACNLSTEPFQAPTQAIATQSQSLPTADNTEPLPTQPEQEQAPVGSLVLGDAWQRAASGMEVRQYLPANDILKTLVAVRLDPAQYTFKAHYRAGEPLTLREWEAELPDADLIINANFFHPDNTVIGMVITDEGAFGATLVNRGGMFSVENGAPRVQSLVEEPYDGRWLDHAVQGFPNLMVNGAASQTNPNENRPSRRTVIASDAQGRIVILATPIFGLSLYELSQYLAASDLQLINTVNLDGGGSTMMMIDPIQYQILSFDAVPTVLAAYPK